MRDQNCPAGCGTRSTPAFELCGVGVSRCPACGLCSLEGEIRRLSTTVLDRARFLDAFRPLRLRNYRRVLDDLDGDGGLRGKRVLDVGSSVGWFLAATAARGARVYGIEPDGYFCERARASLPPGIEVVQGYFPRDLPPSWGPFDVITFHDVFEHLDAPLAVLESCRERLAQGGVTVLSLPSAGGFVYRLGVWLYRLGWEMPLERMYQVHYPFPHLYYFTPRSLALLAQRAGFEIVRIGRLDGFAVRGALARARMDEAASVPQKIARYVMAAALVSFALLQRFVPADSIYVILRPRGA